MVILYCKYCSVYSSLTHKYSERLLWNSCKNLKIIFRRNLALIQLFKYLMPNHMPSGRLVSSGLQLLLSTAVEMSALKLWDICAFGGNWYRNWEALAFCVAWYLSACALVIPFSFLPRISLSFLPRISVVLARVACLSQCQLCKINWYASSVTFVWQSGVLLY